MGRCKFTYLVPGPPAVHPPLGLLDGAGGWVESSQRLAWEACGQGMLGWVDRMELEVSAEWHPGSGMGGWRQGLA